MGRHRYFYEWITTNGYIEGFLITKDFKRVDGTQLNKSAIYFGGWTGRNFHLKVAW